MGHNPLACHTCPVREIAACSALTEQERDELARLGHHRTLQRGQTVFAAGDDAAHCATLITGALKISRFDESGTERILSLVHPAGFVGEMFGPVPDHDVIALTDSVLCVFPAEGYARAVERFPKLARALLRRSAGDLSASRALIDLIGRKTAQGKLAGFLMAMARAAGNSHGRPAEVFELPLSRGEVAGMLGTTIETVSRQMTQLERDGVIRRSGQRGIQLVDAARLAELAG